MREENSGPSRDELKKSEIDDFRVEVGNQDHYGKGKVGISISTNPGFSSSLTFYPESLPEVYRAIGDYLNPDPTGRLITEFDSYAWDDIAELVPETRGYWTFHEMPGVAGTLPVTVRVYGREE